MNIEKIICERKECKSSKRNILKDKIMINVLKILKILKKCEMEMKLKKNKQEFRERRNQVKSIQEVESTSEEDEEHEEIELLDMREVTSFRCSIFKFAGPNRDRLLYRCSCRVILRPMASLQYCP